MGVLAALPRMQVVFALCKFRFRIDCAGDPDNCGGSVEAPEGRDCLSTDDHDEVLTSYMCSIHEQGTSNLGAKTRCYLVRSPFRAAVSLQKAGRLIVHRLTLTTRETDRRNLFSPNGEWIAFISQDDTVWTPTGDLIGRLAGEDIFGPDGVYLVTVVCDRVEFRDDRRGFTIPLSQASSPIVYPGYPGVPAPTLIQPRKPDPHVTATRY